MSIKEHYLQYVSDDELIFAYKNYQDKYKDNPRESDKITINLVASLVPEKQTASIVDIACSTGNFLRHLRKRLPKVKLAGIDLAPGFIEVCKKESSLLSIDFAVADLLKLEKVGQFDIVTANAVTYLFDSSDYKNALLSISKALKPNGAYVGFEFINPFEVQELTIIETSTWNPNGLTLRIRPKKKVEEALKDAGFISVEFYPFQMPFDLPHPGFDADVVTYTRKDESGARMAFRGALYQPWCHFVARKN